MKISKYLSIFLCIVILASLFVACGPAKVTKTVDVKFVKLDDRGGVEDIYLTATSIEVFGTEEDEPTVMDAIEAALIGNAEDYEIDEDREYLEEAFGNERDIDEDENSYSTWLIYLNDDEDMIDDPDDEEIDNNDEILCMWIESDKYNPEEKGRAVVASVTVSFIGEDGEYFVESAEIDVYGTSEEPPSALKAAEEVLQKFEKTYSLTSDGHSLDSACGLYNAEWYDDYAGYYSYWKCTINGEEPSGKGRQSEVEIYDGDVVVFTFTSGSVARQDTTA